jgi:hypothetical protein
MSAAWRTAFAGEKYIIPRGRGGRRRGRNITFLPAGLSYESKLASVSKLALLLNQPTKRNKLYVK